MKVIIEGNPKEVSAFIHAIQSGEECSDIKLEIDPDAIAKEAIRDIRKKALML